MIGKMNIKIALKLYSYSQNGNGDMVKTLATEYSQWCFMENKTGSVFSAEAQEIHRYDARFTFRAYPNRVISSQFMIEQGGSVYRIDSLQKTNEGQTFYWVARATKVDNG